MNEKIVIVEDDESIRMLLDVALTSNGYKTRGFDNAGSALEDMRQAPPRVVILDIMMDGMSGVEALREMRASRALRGVPVIMLTAKDTELDKIIGLDAGADDYMTKPFSVLELCARVRAQLRRYGGDSDADANVIALGGVKLDNNVREVTKDGETLPLTFKEFELLKHLMENSARAVSREELISKIWGGDYYGETRTLDIHIGTLRQKLGDSAENSSFIKTVRGVGYRFVGGVK
ncbi:MAG: response regulator transcription factor [Oscillospiraceae bacterium]|jgi:two-component system alkaline phosphatase synthesis response regulator PhoP|nr:response regulator transcription factor [Oscillospiraceae bacterium]